MISTWKVLVACSAPTIVFGSVVTIRQIFRHSQNIRLPVTEKLLRAPGESLRQRIEILDEQLFHRFLVMFVACSVGMFLLLDAYHSRSFALLILLNIFVVSWVISFW